MTPFACVYRLCFKAKEAAKAARAARRRGEPITLPAIAKTVAAAVAVVAVAAVVVVVAVVAVVAAVVQTAAQNRRLRLLARHYGQSPPRPMWRN